MTYVDVPLYVNSLVGNFLDVFRPFRLSTPEHMILLFTNNNNQKVCIFKSKIKRRKTSEEKLFFIKKTSGEIGYILYYHPSDTPTHKH